MSDNDADEQALARYNARRERMLSRPPRCLAPFAAELVREGDLPGVEFDGHGEPTESIFRVRCRCGGESLRVRAPFHAKDYKGDPLNVYMDPVELVCESCGRTDLLFDREQHGHDAEIDRLEGRVWPPRKPDKAPIVEYRCTGCGGRPMHIFARYEHHPDSCEDSWAEGMPDGYEPNCFTWFTLATRCPACGEVQTVTDFECA